MILKRRQNFLPAFILNFVFWLSWFYIALKIPPDFNLPFNIYHLPFTLPTGYIYFFLTLSLSLSLTFAFIFSNTRRGLLTALFITVFLLLRLIKQAHLLNLLLLAGIIFCLEIYFSRKNKPLT